MSIYIDNRCKGRETLLTDSWAARDLFPGFFISPLATFLLLNMRLFFELLRSFFVVDHEVFSKELLSFLMIDIYDRQTQGHV